MNIENYFKIWAGSGFRRKEGRDGGINRKSRRDGGIREPYCGPSMKVHLILFLLYSNYIVTFFNCSRPSGDQTSTFSGPL